MAGNLPGTGIKPGLHIPSAGISHKPEAHLPSAPSHPQAAWHDRGLRSRRHTPAQPSGQSREDWPHPRLPPQGKQTFILQHL